MNKVNIKNVNSIISTEILLNTYGLDILKYNTEQVEKLIELLEIVKPSLPKLIEKAEQNNQ